MIHFFPMFCPGCGHPLQQEPLKGENGRWYKVWFCRCEPTEQEIQAWNMEVDAMRGMFSGEWEVGQA